MLKPYSFGSTKSPMLVMLKKRKKEKHTGVKLISKEYAKLACWIDLTVPFCGDYTETNAWSDAEKSWYVQQIQKRKRLAVLEKEKHQPELFTR